MEEEDKDRVITAAWDIVRSLGMCCTSGQADLDEQIIVLLETLQDIDEKRYLKEFRDGMEMVADVP